MSTTKKRKSGIVGQAEAEREKADSSSGFPPAVRSDLPFDYMNHALAGVDEFSQSQKKLEEMNYQKQLENLKSIDRNKARNVSMKDQLKDAKDAIGKRMDWLADKDNFDKLTKKMGKDASKIKTDKAEERGGCGWMVIICISLIKDLIDMGSLGASAFISWIVNPVIGILFFFLMGKGTMKMTHRLLTAAGPAILEMIPFSEFMWWWTFSALYVYFKANVHKNQGGKKEGGDGG